MDPSRTRLLQQLLALDYGCLFSGAPFTVLLSGRPLPVGEARALETTFKEMTSMVFSAG